MTAAVKLAERFLFPIFPVNFNGHFDNNRREAGSLHLARNGICFIGHWYSYSQKQSKVLLDCLESKHVVLKGEEGSGLPLQCSIWTYLEQPKNNKQKEQLLTLNK